MTFGFLCCCGNCGAKSAEKLWEPGGLEQDTPNRESVYSTKR